MVDRKFWKDRKVFVTGHTGFKGSWLTYWLHRWGAAVTGYSLEPTDGCNLFESSELTDLVVSAFIESVDLVSRLSIEVLAVSETFVERVVTKSFMDLECSASPLVLHSRQWH